MLRAIRQANPSVGKEYRRFRLQTFAQSEYAVFDETFIFFRAHVLEEEIRKDKDLVRGAAMLRKEYYEKVKRYKNPRCWQEKFELLVSFLCDH